MWETLIGGAFGGILRCVPELLKWLDRKNERDHELKMFDKQLEADKARSNEHIAEIQAQGQVAMDTAGLQALIEAIKGQSQLTGNTKIDALNASVRPVLTYWWCIILYTLVMIAQYIVMLQSGILPLDAILRLWGSPEKSIVSSIFSFWFLDRVLRQNK